MMRVLIVQPRRIGDVILTTPMIDAVRRQHPDARIEFLAEPAAAPVLEGYPGLDETLFFDKNPLRWIPEIRRRQYDWVLDFMCNPRTAQLTWASGAPVRAGFDVPFWGRAYNHRVARGGPDRYVVSYKQQLLDRLGVPPAGAVPNLSHLAGRMEGARAWWEGAGLDRWGQRLALMPMHRHPIRQWPLSKWTELLPLLLARDDRAVLLFGSAEERPALERLAAPHAGRAFVIPAGPLAQAAALLSRCLLGISNDSGLMHLAVAMGLPTVTLYGPTSPVACSPATPRHRALRAEGLACLNCEKSRCPYGHECMAWLSAARVAREAEELAGRAA